MGETIQYDSRENVNQLVVTQLNNLGYKTICSKLFVGDYTFLHKQDICVDRKKDLVEVAGNICGKQHERFRNELIRAKENGIKLYVLIEEENIKKVTEVELWKSPVYKSGINKGKPHTRVVGTTLMKAMLTMQNKYGVKFLFSTKEKFGENIIKLLRGEKNELQ